MTLGQEAVVSEGEVGVRIARRLRWYPRVVERDSALSAARPAGRSRPGRRIASNELRPGAFGLRLQTTRSSILRLTERVFASEESGLRLSQRWDWLFLENTSGAEMYYLVADAGERLAGQYYATMPVRLQHEGKPVLGHLA